MSPAGLGEFGPNGEFPSSLVTAPEIGKWVQETILADDGPLHNPDHTHLLDADVEFMWASSAFNKKGRTVVGQAEEVMFRAGGWQKARQAQQMIEWFGRVPSFLITLAAYYCARSFCCFNCAQMWNLSSEGGMIIFLITWSRLLCRRQRML
jgi:hypothetical protein